MTSRDFCYWLQGFFELEASNKTGASEALKLDYKQVEMVRRHLALVFKHEIDPSHGDEKHQAELDKIHAGMEDLDKKIEKVDSKPLPYRPPTVYRC